MKRKILFALAGIMIFTSLPLQAFAQQEAGTIEAERPALVEGEESPQETPETEVPETESSFPTPESAGLYFEVIDGVGTITGLRSSYDAEELVIPSHLLVEGEEIAVKSIGKEAFNQDRHLKKISLPEGLEVIGKEAFIRTQSLESIELPNTLKTVGESAFEDSESLTKVTIPGSLKIIPKNMFYMCMYLKEVIIEEGVEEIHESAFKNCVDMEKMTIPSTVKSIEPGAFANSSRSLTVTIHQKEGAVQFPENTFPKGSTINYTDPGSEEEEPINVIEDPMLKKAINKELSDEREADQPVTKEELESLETLRIQDLLTTDERWEITSLEGLQHAKNLGMVNLHPVQVTDLSPIANLKHLRNLSIGGIEDKRAPLEDISPLGTLSNLADLRITDNKVKNLSPLIGLKNLKKLYVQNTEVSDVSPLKEVPVSSLLRLDNNRIADFSPLKGKDSSKDSVSLGQNVYLRPEEVEFDNPLIRKDGEYIIIPENEYIEQLGDQGEKLKVCKIPEEDKIVLPKFSYYDSVTIDISDIKDQVPSPDEETQEVYFYMVGKQGEVAIERLFDVPIEIQDSQGNPIENKGEYSHVWNLPPGDYTYIIKAPNYKETKGDFKVESSKMTVEAYPQYSGSETSPYDYPSMSNIKLVEKRTGRVLSEAVQNGQNFFFVIENPEDRKLAYEGNARILADVKNALKYEIKTESTPSEATFNEMDGIAASLTNAKIDWHHPFKEDGLSYMILSGKGGLETHYTFFIKEKETQGAVFFNASIDKDSSSFGGFRIPTSGYYGNEHYGVYRFMQLVDKGQKVIEPLKYIKDKYGKDAKLIHKGGAFEGWYEDRDWVNRFDFESSPIEDGMELKAKFSNSSNIARFPDPYSLWFRGPINWGKGEDIISQKIKDDQGNFVEVSEHSDTKNVLRHKEEFTFKIDLDEGYNLAYLYVKHGKKHLPITQNSDGSFTFIPGDSQDSEFFRKNEIYYDILKKDHSSGDFNIEKQFYVDLESNQPEVSLDYFNSNSSQTSLMGIAGNTIPFKVKGFKIDDVSVETLSGEKIEVEQVGEDLVSDNILTQNYRFVMPNDHVTIKVTGNYVAPSINKFYTFVVKDQEGKEVSTDQINRLTITTGSYSYEIDNIKENISIIANDTGRHYGYTLETKDYGTFYGSFDLDKDSPSEVVLTIDTNKTSPITAEKLQDLIETAKGLLDNKSFTKKSRDELAKAVASAEADLKKQNFENGFNALTDALNKLEKVEDSDHTEKGDKKELKSLVDTLSQLEKDKYTSKTWEDFKEKLDQAKRILKEEDATQKQVNKAKEDLEKSYKNLKEKEEDKQDTKGLDSLLDSLKDLKEDKFTAETWKVFKEKLDEAKKVVKDKSASQDKIDKVKEELAKAYKDLKYKDKEAEKINEEFQKLAKTRFPQIEDVKGHWAEDVIKYVMDRGFFYGTSKTTFSPNKPATRAEFVTVLGRMAKIDEEDYKVNKMKDVPAGVYYEAYVNWAVEKDIIEGVGDKKFAPDKEMTREEMATILDRYLQVTDKKYSSTGHILFNDQEKISYWAEESVNRMTASGFLQGRENKQYAPKASLTRAEVAQIIYNIDAR